MKCIIKNFNRTWHLYFFNIYNIQLDHFLILDILRVAGYAEISFRKYSILVKKSTIIQTWNLVKNKSKTKLDINNKLEIHKVII